MVFLAGSAQKYMQVKQNPKQMIAIVVMTVGFFIACCDADGRGFGAWPFICVCLATVSFAHAIVKEEALLKRRACSVFDLLFFQGQFSVILNLVGITLTALGQWISGNDVGLVMFSRAVFYSSGTFCMTLAYIVAFAIMSTMLLVVLFNSNGVYVATLYFSLIAFVGVFMGEDLIRTGSITYLVGAVMYFVFTNVGKKSLEEHNQVREAIDDYERMMWNEEKPQFYENQNMFYAPVYGVPVVAQN